MSLFQNHAYAIGQAGVTLVGPIVYEWNINFSGNLRHVIDWIIYHGIDRIMDIHGVDEH